MAVICDVCGKEGARRCRVELTNTAGSLAQNIYKEFFIELCEEHAKLSKEEFIVIRKHQDELNQG